MKEPGRIPRDNLAAFRKKAGSLRCRIVRMIGLAGSGHPGGSLSAVDVLTALYYGKLRHRPDQMDWAYRDRFVLSKGHAAPALYAVLGDLGYFDVSAFDSLRKLDGILQGHPDRLTTPGIEVSTGSLGQGLSIAVGMALALRLDQNPARVYVLLGDGESQEGEIWEAAMAAAHYRLGNLCAILDCNGLQIDGEVGKIMNVEPVTEKWRAFGWNCLEVDGHAIGQILDALDQAEKADGSPTMIVARTVKGKGVSFMENVVKFHGVAPTKEECETALKELEGE